MFDDNTYNIFYIYVYSIILDFKRTEKCIDITMIFVYFLCM